MTEPVADPELDWENVDEQMVRTIFGQGEKYLEWQFQSALAADQRATTSASIFVGFSVALLVGVAAYWVDNPDWSLLVSGLLTATLILVGGCCCFMAARPRPFNSPGNEPKEWYGSTSEPLVVALGVEIENYQAKIDANVLVMSSNATWYSCGAITACAAPFVGAILWLLLSC